MKKKKKKKKKKLRGPRHHTESESFFELSWHCRDD
jgi:hypothetical protein